MLTSCCAAKLASKPKYFNLQPTGMQNLAPIALFVYNRPDHMRRTLSYLQKNELAAESRLFIFSDGAKTDADEDKVEQIRQQAK